MIKNLQGMLSPSKKKRTFQSDRAVENDTDLQETDGADPVSNDHTPEKGSRFMRMNVLKISPKLTDEDEASPGVFARRRKSSIVKEEEGSEQLAFSPSYEDAEKKAGNSGMKGNIRGFFTRRKSMDNNRSEEVVVLSPAESNDMYEESEVEDMERSYLEEIFKRKQATMHSDGREEDEQSESQFSRYGDNHNNSNIAADNNKSRRGRRRSVTKMITESRKREEEKLAGNSPVNTAPEISDNHSRRRRRSLHARHYEESPGGKDTNVSDLKDTLNSMRLRRSSVPPVLDDPVQSASSDRRTRRGRRSISVTGENMGSRNRNAYEESGGSQPRTRRNSIGDDKNDLRVNDRRSRLGQRTIQDSVEKQSSEDKHDKKSRRAHKSLGIGEEAEDHVRERDIAKTRGDAHFETRDSSSIFNDRQKRRNISQSRNRSRSPMSAARNRSRSVSKGRHRDRSSARKRSKSRKRVSEAQVTRERRRSRSRHRPSVASSAKSDVGHKRRGTHKGASITRELDVDRHKNPDWVSHKDDHNNRDLNRGSDHCSDRKRRTKNELAERGSHTNESGVRDLKSRRKYTNDDQSSSRSYLSDSASSLNSSCIDEGSRGGHATSNQIGVPISRDRTSKRKNKVANYRPSDERIRLMHDLEIKPPSNSDRKNKQKNTEEMSSRRIAGDKSINSKTGQDLLEANLRPQNEYASIESSGEETDALLFKINHSMTNQSKEAMYESEGVHNSQGMPDLTSSPGEKRSRSRRVALSSVFDSDIGREREADILSLASSPTKLHTGSPKSSNLATTLQVEGRRATMVPDRDGKSCSSKFTGFRPEYDVGLDSTAPDHSKVSHSSGDIETSVKCNAPSSTLQDGVSNSKRSQNSLDLDSLPTNEVDSQPKQNGTKVDILTAASKSGGTDLNIGAGGNEMAANGCHLDLPIGKAIAKVTGRSELLGNEEKFPSGVGSTASYRKANDIKNKDLIQISREQRLRSKETRRGREVSSAETIQGSILSSPMSKRSHRVPRKSVKEMSRRGDKHARTKAHDRDHRVNRKRSPSPPHKNVRRGRSKDDNFDDSMVSSWRPPRIKERDTDTSGRSSQVRRRRPSQQVEGLRESYSNDATSGVYEEEDVFTLYTWSGNRQGEDKIQRERLALKDSIRARSFFRAYENMETR